MFSFGGFGTLGVVHSTQDKADFTSSSFEATGAGHTHAWSAAVDSLIAAQLTANFSPRLSAVVQVISREIHDDSYRPQVEWANIKYQVTPDFSVRVGRIALPIYLVTDSVHVGYANPWVRPPVELYSLVSVTSNDGLDASYRVAMGATSNTVQASIGRANYTFPIPNGGGNDSVRSRQQLSLTDSVESGPLTVRFTYGQAHVWIPIFDPLFDGFRQFGVQGAAIADRYGLNGRRIYFLGTSASYDPGKWFAMGEWGRVNSHSLLGDKTAWYLSGGYRVARFTPYATYARLTADSRASDPGLNLTALPPASVASAAGLNAALNGTLGAIAAQHTISVGARWDVRQNIDLKVQFDRVALGAHSPGTLFNLQPGFQLGSTLSLFTATVDFVF